MPKAESDDKETLSFANKVGRRAVEFERIYNFLKSKQEDIFSSTFINKDLLGVAVRSYFHDIERLKEFHEIEFADKHKKFGFSLKWICKIRPIQLYPSKQFIPKKHHLVNEIFAFYCGVSFLKIPHSYALNTKAWQALIYTLHFRNLSGEYLSLVAYLIEENAILTGNLDIAYKLTK